MICFNCYTLSFWHVSQCLLKEVWPLLAYFYVAKKCVYIQYISCMYCILLNLTGTGVLLQETLLTGICQKRQQISSTNATHQTMWIAVYNQFYLLLCQVFCFYSFHDMIFAIHNWLNNEKSFCFSFSPSLEKHAPINCLHPS